ETDAESSAHLDPSAVAVTTADAGVRERGERLVVQTHFAPAREVEIPEGVGGHGGGDALLLRDVFVGPTQEELDGLARPSDHRDGMRAIAVGICGNVSLETGGPVDVRSTLGIDLAREPRGSAPLAPAEEVPA
ncbi:MAG TPA: gfo/Idh/MocA family oxidoreductase, partial [Brachybacterium sp.]